MSEMSWDDLPKQPWPEATEPPTEALADWLLSLSREQFLWLLDTKRRDWSKDSDCFMRDHEGRIEHAEQIIRQAVDHWQRGYNQGFDDAKARALEVVREH